MGKALRGAMHDLTATFCTAAAMCMNYKWAVHGKENLPRGRAILAANHSSYLDPIILGITLGRLSYISRNLNPNKSFTAELLQYWLRLVGVIKIERERMGRHNLSRILGRLKNNEKIVVFPEGTRSYDGKLQEFNDGASLLADLSESPVVPVMISGTYEIWPRGRQPKYSGHIRIGVCNKLYPNKEITDKYARRRDLTERIKNSMENRLLEPYS